ncbi:FkbM family methyltransferase, partial [Candidatus Marinamargulisbacteria bacterium]|nr:FkbM family methyltransferase [Candidatus Marinamargulisbacteria bacterium]
EIGAHYGEDSRRFLDYFSDVKLICFEPDPRNSHIFKTYIDDQRVTLYEEALSNKVGMAPFYQSFQNSSSPIPDKYQWIDPTLYHKHQLHNSGASSLKKGYNHLLKNPIQVPTNRFDCWHQSVNNPFIDLVWLDVQGAEKEVIEGMGNAIASIHYIWMEYGELDYDGALSRQATIDFMTNKGFSLAPFLSNRGLQGDALFYQTNIGLKRFYNRWGFWFLNLLALMKRH